MRLRKLVLAVLVAAIAAIAVVATASANSNGHGPFNGPDPQESNVPTVGWVGQTLRVAKCLPFEIGDIDDASASQLELEINISVPGSFLIEDWSGLQTNWAQWQTGGDPRLATSPVRITNRGVCWAANMVSPKPGLAVWKLSVELKVLIDLAVALESRGFRLALGVEDLALIDDIVLEHQGLALFMEEAGVSLVEVGADGPGLSNQVGDPAGDGVFTPPYDCSAYQENGDTSADSRFGDPLHRNLFCVFGLVKVNVKGSFPLGNNFSGIIAGDVVTLPDDWADLANGLAIDKDTSRPGSAAWRWDIHDDQAPGDGLFDWHPYGGEAPADGKLPDHHEDSICNTGTNTSTDAVDNCLGGLGDGGLFSSIYGGTYPTIGPFDAVRPDETLLSNGVLDAGDAPMPSLPVEVSLGADSIGALSKVDKEDIYTVLGPHAGQGPPVTPKAGTGYPHNLYAPFYNAYIPAAGPGLNFRTGPYQAGTNNFPGYIEDGVYSYWNTFNKTYRNGYNGCKDVLGNDVPMPTGADKVEVYTDEHGEAWVKFYPYRGLFLEPDLNGLCDIYTSGGAPAPYGEATITAAPYYPGQPVFTPGFQWGTASVDKVAYHLADKTLVCVPKAVNVAFCVETVVDYNGDPIEGVKVKFTTSGDSANMVAASIKYSDDLDTRGQGVITSGGEENFVVVTTNARGQAGVEIVHSQDTCIDVTAENWYTRNGGFGILRFFEFNPHTGVACGGSTGGGGTPPPSNPPSNPPATNGGGSSNGGGGGSSQGTVVSLGGPVIQAQPVLSQTKTAVIASSNAKLFSVKVLQTKLGRFLVVNVKASKDASKQKVLFLVKRNGKLVKQWKMVPAAKLSIQILGKNGNVLRTITRTVPVNKAYQIQNLKLPKAAVSVKTSVKA